MKNFIAVLFLIGLFSAPDNVYAQAEGTGRKVVLSEAENLVFKTQNGEEIVFDRNGNLYNGAVVLPDEENRQVTYFYENGKKHGVANSKFLSNGKIGFETTYANGKKNGEEILFFFNGNPKYKRTYKDDLLDGEEVLYYQNGKPKRLNHYLNGKLTGVTTYFDENGEIVRTETYKDGMKNGPVKIIKNNTLLEEIDFVNDKREGLYKTYSSEGSRREVPYKNDKKEGEGRIFSANNMIIESVIYSNDKRNGLYQKLSLSGKLISVENYKDDVRDGISRYFDDKGKLVSVSYYIDGVELSQLQIAKRSDLTNIQDAIFDNQISRYSNKKSLWYKILWLGLNLNKPEILEILEKEMKMYAADINNMSIYKRWSGSMFDSENKQLFFGLSPLDYAINIEAPTEVLQKFVNQVDEKNSRGLTPLRDAVRLNKTDMVKYLILSGADLKEKDSEGNDILLYAILNESPNEMIKTIINSNADVNTKNNIDQTPLTVALAQKNVELVKMLIKAGADTGNMPDGQNLLFYAYDKKVPLDIISELLDNGADINSVDFEGNNLLLKALKNDDETTALFAIEQGADINLKDPEGETAVSYVLFNKASPKVVKKIFSMEYNYGEKLEKPNKMLWKVLMEQNKLDLLKEVWDKMPDISTTPDAMGEIPLQVALKGANNPELHKLALSYIKKADDKMVWGALKEEDFSLFRDLLAKDANINSQNEDGDIMLTYIVKNDYNERYTDLVLSKGADINAENTQKQTALDIAVQKGNIKVAKYLLEKGANPNREVEGETYLSKATASQSELTELLLSYTKNLKPTLSNGESLLMRSVKNLNLPLFEFLAKQKDVDFTVVDDNGNTLLLASADYFENPDSNIDEKLLSKNFLTIAKALLDKGLDINARNDNGETLLIKLARHCGLEYDELAKFLISKGANTELRDQLNNTADDYRKKLILSD